MSLSELKSKLEKIYKQYNKKKLVPPDPLQFLYNYKKIQDREIVALIASSLAFGNVKQIVKNVEIALNIIGYAPYDFIDKSSSADLHNAFKNFSYRFVCAEDMISLLLGIKEILSEYSSLNECFIQGCDENDKNILPAILFFTKELTKNYNPGYLIANPEKMSACKRMNLFLRWVVRFDDVDPGGWEGVLPSKLIIPVDTHMHKIGLHLKFTDIKSANMKSAIEITNAFAKISFNDPVKYDFSLTRFGIRDDMQLQDLFEEIY